MMKNVFISELETAKDERGRKIVSHSDGKLLLTGPSCDCVTTCLAFSRKAELSQLSFTESNF